MLGRILPNDMGGILYCEYTIDLVYDSLIIPLARLYGDIIEDMILNSKLMIC